MKFLIMGLFIQIIVFTSTAFGLEVQPKNQSLFIVQQEVTVVINSLSDCSQIYRDGCFIHQDKLGLPAGGKIIAAIGFEKDRNLKADIGSRNPNEIAIKMVHLQKSTSFSDYFYMKTPLRLKLLYEGIYWQN